MLTRVAGQPGLWSRLRADPALAELDVRIRQPAGQVLRLRQPLERPLQVPGEGMGVGLVEGGLDARLVK